MATGFTFPRTAEAIVRDNGNDSYRYLTPSLMPGNYRVNVLQIDDEGNTEDTDIPDDINVVVKSPPAAATITTITSLADGMGGLDVTVNWTIGVAGCTFILYYSDLDCPVNLFADGLPTPIGPSVVDATSAVIHLDSIPSAHDYSTDWATLLAVVDALYVDDLADFLAGEVTFLAANPLDSLASLTAIIAAFNAYDIALQDDFGDQLDLIRAAASTLISAVSDASGIGLAADDWANAIGPVLGTYYATIGESLSGDVSRYFIPGYNYVLPGETISVLEQSQPLQRPTYMRVIVRTTKAAMQEVQDAVKRIEFGAAGAIVGVRPNKAVIEYFNVTGGNILTVHASVIEDNAVIVAQQALLFVVQDIFNFDFGDSQASANLGAVYANYHAGDAVFTIPGTGWYKFCVRGYNSGAYSPVPTDDEVFRVFIGQTVGAVREFGVKVQNGLGV